jgi:signal transduction histidine kinase
MKYFTARTLETRLIIIYFLFGTIYIFLSDYIFFFFEKDIVVYKNLQTFKGVLFILLSGAFFYWYIHREIGSKEKLRKKLENSRAENQKMIIETLDRERHRIAMELHDSVQQKLAASAMMVSSMQEENKQMPGAHKLSELLRESIDEIRQIASNESLAGVESEDLSDSLSTFFLNLSYQTGLHIENQVQVGLKLPVFAKINIYRITQELLTNTIKHSGSLEVWYSLGIKGKYLELFYKDGGKNFELSKGAGGGLKNIRARVHSMEGLIELGKRKVKRKSKGSSKRRKEEKEKIIIQEVQERGMQLTILIPLRALK